MGAATPDFEQEDGGLDETPEEMIYAFAGAPGLQSALVGTSAGLLRSGDGGQTWQDCLADLNLSEPVPVVSLALSPDGRSAFAGAPGGIFLSRDGGESWKALLLPPPPPTVSSLAVSPAYDTDETLFAGTMEDGVFISRDGGESWAAWNFGLLDLNVLCLAISPAFANDETLFAGTESGLFRSTNGGRAWREVELPFGFEAVLAAAISPNFAADGTLYLGTETQGIWISRDGGDTWQPAGEVADPVNALSFYGGELIAVTSGAILRSAGGADWQPAYTPHGGEIAAALPLPGGQALIGLTSGEIQLVPLA